MAQLGVGAAALTGRLCGHAERVHGVCGSSVLPEARRVGAEPHGLKMSAEPTESETWPAGVGVRPLHRCPKDGV